MATLIDYALLSANVYGTSPDVRNQRNTLPIPDGWTTFGQASGYQIDDHATGFMAGVYVNGNEVVISYSGTTDENTLDWTQGNLPAGAATSLAPQVLQAAEFYLKVAADPQFAGKTISFTGHSLGGGLASLMAVWFDRPATVFDEAFFSKSADSGRVVDALRDGLRAKGYTVPAALASYQTDAPLGGEALNVWNPSPTRLVRQAQVENVFIKGEVLSLLPDGVLANLGGLLGSAAFGLGYNLIAAAALYAGNGIGKINDGTSIEIDLNARSGLGWGWNAEAKGVAGNPVDLHSISLLTACLLTPQFTATLQEHPELLQRLFGGLYENNPKSRQANLVDLLVQREYRGEGSLGALSADVNMIDTANGLTSVTHLPGPSGRETASVAAVLVDAVLAGLYEQGKGRTPEQPGGVPFKALLQQVGGGLVIDTARLGTESSRVEAQLRDLLQSLLDSGVHASAASQARWTVQSGSSVLQVEHTSDARSDVVLGYSGADRISTGAGNDILAGNDGADTLLGGAGSDVLAGGAADDTLDGGDNGDYLYGGAGSDTYRFSGSFGSDWVVDSDGFGHIEVDGRVIDGSGSKKVGDGVYEDDDWLYTLMDNGSGRSDLILQRDSSLNTIRIRDWGGNGTLGIRLNEQPATPPQAALNLTGDFVKALDTDGITYRRDGLGNYLSDGAQPGAADVLNGDGSANLIQGLDGNDGLAGQGGDDRIEGGAGDDLILGALGATCSPEAPAMTSSSAAAWAAWTRRA